MVTGLFYAYSNSVATSTHVIRIYDMVPPSAPHTTTGGATFVTISKGALLTQLTLAGLPAGQYAVAAAVSNLHLPNSAVWIKFEESGPGAPGTLWLTGAIPLNGYSHPGLTYSVDGYSNYHVNLPYFSFATANYATHGGLYYLASNVVVGLYGFHIPAPPTIAAMGLGAWLVLCRRCGARDRQAA